jgi:hypothetical protein
MSNLRQSLPLALALLAYLWALPNTLLGLALALLSRLAGGVQAQKVCGVVEVYGPGVRRLLRLLRPAKPTIDALTLGHVVLACDRPTLERTRGHEAIHVRQYERWGPFFLPAYWIAGLLAARRGGDSYRDNPFEKQARL